MRTNPQRITLLCNHTSDDSQYNHVPTPDLACYGALSSKHTNFFSSSNDSRNHKDQVWAHSLKETCVLKLSPEIPATPSLTVLPDICNSVGTWSHFEINRKLPIGKLQLYSCAEIAHARMGLFSGVADDRSPMLL